MYSVDGDSGFIEQSNIVLLKMGKYMEKILTTDSDFFKENFMIKPGQKAEEVGVDGKDLYDIDYYRYLKSGNLMLRS
jgi:CRISPR/Cas system CMR-associated protein Cmr3 (group 5 of RAMP superfamily)